MASHGKYPCDSIGNVCLCYKTIENIRFIYAGTLNVAKGTTGRGSNDIEHPMIRLMDYVASKFLVDMISLLN